MPNLERELNNLINPKRDELKGSLGLSRSIIKVTNRPGFVWVRLLDNPNELIKAHNSKVALRYNLPVILVFDGKKYEITGVDTDRYSNWSSESSFVPNHGWQHSARRGHEGGDITWVDTQQFLPLLVMPNVATGTQNVIVNPYNYRNSLGNWLVAGGTGTLDLTPITVSGSNVYLIMLKDSDGSIYAITGTGFSSNITGTEGILSKVPYVDPASDNQPLAAVKVTPGKKITWDDIFDLRQFFGNGLSSLIDDSGAYSTWSTDSTHLVSKSAIYNAIEGTASIVEKSPEPIFSVVNPGGPSVFMATLDGNPPNITPCIMPFNTITGSVAAITPVSYNQLAKLIMHNTTRGTSVQIYTADGSTFETQVNAFALGWRGGDTITIQSQTLSGDGQYWVDLELIPSIDSNAYNSIWLKLIMEIESSMAGDRMIVHPFSATFGTWKYDICAAMVAGPPTSRQFAEIALTNNKFCLSWNGNPNLVSIREAGHIRNVLYE